MWLALVLAFSVEPYAAIESGEQEWSIASNLSGTATPNIRSELKFDDVETVYLGLRGDMVASLPWAGLSLIGEGRIAGGVVQDGQVVDADYNGNQRTELFSLSSAHIRGDDAVEIEAGLGLKIPLGQQQALTFLLGGVRFEHTLNFYNGTQLAIDPAVIFTPIDDLTEHLQANLDSDYFSEWSGGWLAADYEWHSTRWLIALRADYYLGTYYGEGRWNLRDSGPDAFQQPKSFSHHADADGIKLSATLGYALSEAWWLKCVYERAEWNSESGTAYTYYADGTLGAARFNGAQWQSSQLQLGLEFRF